MPFIGLPHSQPGPFYAGTAATKDDDALLKYRLLKLDKVADTATYAVDDAIDAVSVGDGVQEYDFGVGHISINQTDTDVAVWAGENLDRGDLIVAGTGVTAGMAVKVHDALVGRAVVVHAGMKDSIVKIRSIKYYN